mmetsp:Transcript_14634/g.33635  ORF Transcript_14634/g.33635 Transcript_14634/m.33635 type:complete len:137 (+) Transcript_14634:1699-2109(+)
MHKRSVIRQVISFHESIHCFIEIQQNLELAKLLLIRHVYASDGTKNITSCTKLSYVREGRVRFRDERVRQQLFQKRRSTSSKARYSRRDTRNQDQNHHHDHDHQNLKSRTLGTNRTHYRAAKKRSSKNSSRADKPK